MNGEIIFKNQTSGGQSVIVQSAIIPAKGGFIAILQQPGPPEESNDYQIIGSENLSSGEYETIEVTLDTHYCNSKGNADENVSSLVIKDTLENGDLDFNPAFPGSDEIVASDTAHVDFTDCE